MIHDAEGPCQGSGIDTQRHTYTPRITIRRRCRNQNLDLLLDVEKEPFDGTSTAARQGRVAALTDNLRLVKYCREHACEPDGCVTVQGRSSTSTPEESRHGIEAQFDRASNTMRSFQEGNVKWESPQASTFAPIV